VNATLRILLAGTAIVLAGCGGAKKVAAPPVGDPSQVEVTLTANPAQLRPGETAEIVVAMTNPQRAPVTLTFRNGCILVFSVTDGSGVLVGPEARFCTGDLPIVQLGPGEARSVTFHWAGTGDGNLQLAPGTYRLVGSVTANETKRRSAPVPFQILAP
jgi:hypothetical protein